jgi:hypothetical protein
MDCFATLATTSFDLCNNAIGMYSRQCLGDGRIGTLENLKVQTKAWNKRINQKKTKINWRFTKSKARKSLLYKSP